MSLDLRGPLRAGQGIDGPELAGVLLGAAAAPRSARPRRRARARGPAGDVAELDRWTAPAPSSPALSTGVQSPAPDVALDPHGRSAPGQGGRRHRCGLVLEGPTPMTLKTSPATRPPALV
ncbi:hypothetical protein [Sorangium sp. So ce204]|uniref:hypothetical protein n=1 Tax=Sorangium sp. So ce204 TaxID=3133288 RepID=UPI003F62E32C